MARALRHTLVPILVLWTAVRGYDCRRSKAWIVLRRGHRSSFVVSWMASWHGAKVHGHDRLCGNRAKQSQGCFVMKFLMSLLIPVMTLDVEAMKDGEAAFVTHHHASARTRPRPRQSPHTHTQSRRALVLDFTLLSRMLRTLSGRLPRTLVRSPRHLSTSSLATRVLVPSPRLLSSLPSIATAVPLRHALISRSASTAAAPLPG